ncbi:MAG: hypothetical protein V7672_10000 [Brevundimonas sp.]|uniref:hypothetical protein n=1 Tax=Brevundimonas sp. TaxID=1871086 RepID=UPI0030025EF5
MTATEATPDPDGLRQQSRPGRWRRWMPRAIFESLLIVFSVFLALGLNNWAEDRRESERLAEMRTYLVQEIRQNRDTLASDHWLPHHTRLRDAVMAVALSNPTRDEVRQLMGALFDTGIHTGATRDPVWQAIQASGLLTEMDAEELLLVSNVYRGQASLERVDQQMVGVVAPLLQSVETGEGMNATLMTLGLLLSDVVALEGTLIQRYDAALAVMDPGGEAATTATGDAASPTG